MKKILSFAVIALFISLSMVCFTAVPSHGARQGSYTRHEIALTIARSFARIDPEKASADDLALAKKIALEFWDDLEYLGVNLKLFLASFTDVADIEMVTSPDAGLSRSMDLVPGEHWVYDAIRQLSSSGVISYYPDDSYAGPMSMSAPGTVRNIPGYVLGAAGAPKPGASGYAYSRPMPAQDTARYGSYSDNPVKQVETDSVATFGLDVNTTSYSNVRRFLNGGSLPPADAVRVEELVNYFPPAAGDKKPDHLENSPFYIAYELAPCPWDGDKTLLWLSLAARGLDYSAAPPANLVFLVDVSGSMSPPERLPLVKSALKMLAGKLRQRDSISIVTYAGSTQVALPATQGRERAKIIAAIDSLGAGGSTAGAAGLTLAYEQARKAFIKGGVKMMTRISSVGNGNYSYVDSMAEARKVLDEEMASTLVTVAKDVKAQIEFNPANVAMYRQIGYEKRQLRNEDFSDDAVDAGDVGAGRRVTVMYELTLASGDKATQSRYREISSQADKAGEIAYLKFRWKEPDGKKSSLAELPILKEKSASRFEAAGEGLRFFASVAAFGQKLRGNPSLNETTWRQIESWADAARGRDPYRAEFLSLVKLADAIPGERD